MKALTSTLIGPALDWAVAKVLGEEQRLQFEGDSEGITSMHFDPYHGPWNPSTDPSQAYPIIEREKISVWWHEEYGCWCAASKAWMEADPESEEFLAMPDAYRGDTPFIAGLRCFVASKLGDTVGIPEELL